MNAIKLEDIAKKLNISVSTVSRALSGNGRVGEKTRRRVLEAVRESDYTVNAVAQSLRIRNSKNIGIIVPDISNGFFASLIKGAQQICRQSGYTLMVCNSEEDAEYETEALHMLLEKQISGLIFASVGDSCEYTRQYARLNIPIVFVDNIPENTQAHDVVTIDNVRAAKALTRAMIERGYRDLGMITGPQTQATGHLRYKGFASALREAGISPHPEWIRASAFHMEGGYQQMKALLALNPRPRAMIFGNNHLAYGAVNAIREAGLHIPGDIAIASFDAEDRTGLITPLITSINQPAQEIGTRAAEIIFARMSDTYSQKSSVVILEPRFVDGESW